jgi:hypothetical protein
MSTRKFGTYATREEFLENEVRTLSFHIQSMIDMMKVMSMNRQDLLEELERMKLELKTAVVAEREACAELCVKLAVGGGFAADCAAAIRARGQE